MWSKTVVTRKTNKERERERNRRKVLAMRVGHA